MIELYPYQEEGVKFLVSRSKALLADEMGIGKTAQAIRACDAIGAKNIVVLCPATVRVNWQREFEKFSQVDRRCHVVTSGRDRIQAGITVCSYDLASRPEINRQLMALEIDVLIPDEAHYLKSRKTKRTKAVYGSKCDGKSGFASRAKNIFCLTGTPAPNHPAELWPMLHVLGAYDRGYWDFVQQYCTGYDNGFGFQITGGKNIRHLRQRLAPILLRRKKEDVLPDLPPISYNDIVIEGQDYWDDDEQKALFGAIRTDMEAEFGEILVKKAEAGHVISRSNEDMHIAKLRRLTGLAKVYPVAKLLTEELDADEYMKVVVFGIHREPIEYLRQELSKFKPVVVYGGTPVLKRQAKVDRFNNNWKCRVFIGNVKAAGTGINLTAASDVVFMESSWTPAENQQAAMRCHRIGQKRPVLVRFIGMAGTVDEHVQRTLARKTRLLDQMFD